jgi:hypothetical protein
MYYCFSFQYNVFLRIGLPLFYVFFGLDLSEAARLWVLANWFSSCGGQMVLGDRLME